MNNYYSDEFNDTEEIDRVTKVLNILFIIGMILVISGIGFLLASQIIPFIILEVLGIVLITQ